MIKAILSASMLIAAAIASPASARDFDTTVEIVRTGDLNLASPRGVAALDRRIAAAVSNICGSADTRDLVMSRAVQACRVATRASAADQRLTALAAAQRDLSTRVAAR